MYVLLTILLIGCSGSGENGKSGEGEELSCAKACTLLHKDPRNKEAKDFKDFYSKAGEPANDRCRTDATLAGKIPQEYGCDKQVIDACADACEKHKKETQKTGSK